eukprot:TRINITY_DN39718_c0_g1_i3.p1 TRINITY_DN39718_c0_g1~~TRINITY_DN39718_c0_g1_i3.p1  ORF type:complete len:205 (-),score=46.57 TRINITY_DN39718_c0_g1_i3:53-586(-)
MCIRDSFGYDPAYSTQLFSVCTDGTGSGWHCWKTSAPVDEWPVVFLGSEGERAKVGNNSSEFLQIGLSLQPHFVDAIGRLPGLNTLPDNGDIEGATEEDFKLKEVEAMVQRWLLEGEDEQKALVETASTLLRDLGIPRLTVGQALKKLIEAHLALPRFAIQSPDMDDDLDAVLEIPE